MDPGTGRLKTARLNPLTRSQWLHTIATQFTREKMGHALTSTAACQTAGAMALEKAQLGVGSEVVECTRQALDSHDLAYKVRGASGAVKSVVVTDRELRMRLERVGRETA